jgi:uncharacterized protein (DUF849 family)
MQPENNLDFPYPITEYPKLIINAAITGMIPKKKDNPNTPISVNEIIDDAIRCYKAGASIIHIHTRDDDQEPTYKKEIFAQIFEGIRKQCPEIIICATTSGRNYNIFEKRSQVLELTGNLKPDMASLTMNSINVREKSVMNSAEMIENLALKMNKNGIIPEIEIFDAGMISTIKIMIKKGILKPPFYANLLFGSMYSIPATMFDLSYLVKSLPSNFNWAVAGIGKFQLKMNLSSVLMGGHVRVGLEDNLYYDHEKKQLATNEKLVTRIVNFSNNIGRKIATAQETREMLGIPQLILNI